MTKRFGFTLAEVLITLTIIGVIAAMTIPTLMSNTSDQEYKTGLKKAISTLNQAITMQYALDGTNMSDFTSKDSTTEIFGDQGVVKELFQQRMQVISTTNKRGTKGYKVGAATESSNAAIYLSDGMVVEFPNTFAPDSNASKECRENPWRTDKTEGCLYTIIVDVNGDKGNCNVGEDTQLVNNKVRPKDCFPLNVYEDGVRPANFVGREIMYSGK